MNEPRRTDPPPEQAVFLGEGGPAAAAASWARFVLDDNNLGAAWPLMDRPLRLALVQSWLLNAYTGPLRDKDMLAGVIEEGGHPLWARFAAWRMQRWHAETFAFLLSGWGVVSIPEAASADIEFVRLTSATGGHAVEAGQPMTVQTLRVRSGTLEPSAADRPRSGAAELPDAAQLEQGRALTMRFVDQRWLLGGIGRTLAVPGWPPSEQTLSSPNT